MLTSGLKLLAVHVTFCHDLKFIEFYIFSSTKLYRREANNNTILEQHQTEEKVIKNNKIKY